MLRANESEIANIRSSRELAEFYIDLFSETRRHFVDEWKCDLLSVFRELRQTGALEIIASAATHGLLPILQQQSPRAARAQVLIGRDVYVELFGGEPAGFWLPECGYALRFGIDSTGSESSLVRCRRSRVALWNAASMLLHLCSLLHISRASGFRTRSPASRRVWSAHEGYPGDPAYRDFYRDIGFDLPMEHLGSIARGTRKFSGVKYHRITGRGDEKQLYDRTAAENAAAQHAIHFLKQIHEQIREISEVGFDPIIVAPFDAELFGHWWFEGPIFLEQFIRHAANERDFRLTSPSEYLAAHPTQQIVEPAASTWGENGHLAVWLDPSNAWIYPQLNAAAQKMIELAEQFPAVVGQSVRLPTDGLAGEAPTLQPTDSVLKQLARELLLAQSSDWAFLMKTATAREYATQRTIDHLARFNRLHDQFVTNNLDEEFLRDCEWRDNFSERELALLCLNRGLRIAVFRLPLWSLVSR